MNIERWSIGYKATASDWYDGKNIYFCVEYFKPGQSLSAPPAWSKSFLLPRENERTIATRFDSVVNALAMATDKRMMLSEYRNGEKIVENGKELDQRSRLLGGHRIEGLSAWIEGVILG